MSNLGLRILYGLLNGRPGICCERFFSPGIDMEEVLRSKNPGFLSLESARPLLDFDIIGISLAYELLYSNILNLLELGNVPLCAVERDNSFPLVIAGGPSVLNPEPMHEFFDFFVIGEGEEVILEIIGLYKKLKDDFRSGKISKPELLIAFAGIEGVYVPSLYEVDYNAEGNIAGFRPKNSFAPEKIKKRFINDLDGAYFPEKWVVPYIEIVHDRITLEIMRGCPNRCNFCQARQQYYPMRIRNVENIMSLANACYKNSGYEEISLAGLSVSDYPFIKELLGCMVASFKDKTVNISLPSIKPKAYLGGLASLIATTKKTGLTFAPEAATDKLRRVLNKDFDMDSFLNALADSYASGYQRVKLYFMTGLPFEQYDDLDAIIGLCTEVSELKKKSGQGGAAFVNASINTMIPKPHTPFQWLGMEDKSVMEEKAGYLRSKLKNKKIKLNFHNTEMSFLEAVLSRGDRRLSAVIKSAFKKGARFDAWDEHFVMNRWLQAFDEQGIDPKFYLKEKRAGQALPWDILDTGVAKSALLEEYNKISSI